MPLESLKAFLVSAYVISAGHTSEDLGSLASRLSWKYASGYHKLVLQSSARDEARWDTGWFIEETEESWNLGTV